MRDEIRIRHEDDSPHPLLPQYHREREIGHGEYGVVYLAKRLGAYYALKVVRLADNADAARAEAYARELRGVRLVMGLPPIEGLVRIHDLAERPDGSEFAYAMDLADPEQEETGPFGDNFRPRTLASVIDAEIALPLNECLDIAIRIASVLVALQRRHIIHRDIKPGNIIFVRGKAVLADVGLAIDARDAASIVGTPGYAPPERQGSPAGDVFGLGKTLYRISTGRQPSEEGLPPCTEADVDSPYFWKWMTILSKATSRNPAQRYRSAKGFLRDLRRLRLLASPAKRVVRYLVAAFLIVGVILPALWELPLARACAQLSPEDLQNTILPYPYSVVKPIFMLRSRLRQAAEDRQRQIERQQEYDAQRQQEIIDEKNRLEKERQSKAEKERRRGEEERRRAEEELRRRAEEELKAEEIRKAEEQRKVEEQRRIAELQAEERRKEEKRRIAAEQQAEEKRKVEEEQERKKEELRQRLEKEWRETMENEKRTRMERVRLKAERDRRERESLATEITGAIASFLNPASPLDAVRASLSAARVFGVAAEHLGYFLDWANLNPDIHPDVRRYYLDRRPIPPPYDMLRPFLVSTNAPPYPYDVLDSYVKEFMLEESLGEVRTIDWSDWSDDEFESKTLRAHFLLPMHGHKRNAWELPRRVILTGNPFLSDEERIRKELDEKKTSEERNLDWQLHMRTPLDDINGEESDD